MDALPRSRQSFAKGRFADVAYPCAFWSGHVHDLPNHIGKASLTTCSEISCVIIVGCAVNERIETRFGHSCRRLVVSIYMETLLIYGSLVGIIHFAIIGALYGNPVVDRLYQKAMANEPGMKKWPSKARYLATQFAGTQVEVFILVASFLWLRSQIPVSSTGEVALVGIVFAGIRVYPRFWNMWVQSSYPNRLLAVEFVNGVISTLVIVFATHVLV